mmetsp:Transcript_107088/g.185283  ORF Transcript_107088/g.185283 Transcript_107088/m.185283 type:complete len:1645 (+) Transcript_107088:82-5016(+)
MQRFWQECTTTGLLLAVVLGGAAAARCSAPIVANATRPSCAEGPEIEDRGVCTTRCLPGLHPSRPSLQCYNGFLQPAAFTCGANCEVPDGVNTLSPPCEALGGQSRTSSIKHGSSCRPVCKAGLEPFEEELICDNGKLLPNPIIHCERPCDAPAGISGAESVPCFEGFRIPDGGVCTPQCQADHDLVGDDLKCTNGTLTPSEFVCRQPFTCSLPPEDLWTQAFPASASEDYPAENTCLSASDLSFDGKGCPQCYGPTLEIDAQASGHGLDVGVAAELVLKFSSTGGRRLVFVTKNEKDLPNLKVVWRTSTPTGTPASSITTSHEVFVHDFNVPVGDAEVGVPHINKRIQLDSGKFVDMAEQMKEVVLRTPLERPEGADLLLSVSFSLLYVIAGCSAGVEGQGAAVMTLAVRSLAYNFSACPSPGRESSCSLSCLPGTSGQPRASCREDDGTFLLSGCYADCQAPDHFVAHVQKDGIQNAEAETCAEGATLQHGSACTTMCIPGYTAVPASLLCQDKRLLPPRFECRQNCQPPSHVYAHVGTPPCQELLLSSVLRHGGLCTPRCAAGFRPDRFEPMMCSDGKLEPSTFRCDPVLVAINEFEDVGVESWTAFSSAGHHYVVAAGKSSSVFHVAPGGQGQLQMTHAGSYNSEALHALPVAVDEFNGSSVLFVTARQRSLGTRGIGGPSPVFHWHQDSLSVVHLQDLPLAGCAALASAAIDGQRVLIAGSSVPAADYARSAVFKWNPANTSFVKVQQLDIAALAVAVFTHDGNIYVGAVADAAAGPDHLSRMYRWETTAPDGNRLTPVAEFATPHVIDIIWLGCQDDAAFADASGEPCYRLPRGHCNRSSEVRAACAALCGCAHDVSAVAVAGLEPSPHIKIFVIRTLPSGNLQLSEISSARATAPMSKMCTFFAPIRNELYLISLADGYVNEPISSIFAWRSLQPGNESFERVLDHEFHGAMSCTTIQTSTVSYVLTGSPGHAEKPAKSEVFVVEGQYNWDAHEWEACSLECRPVGPEVSVRQRTVLCTGAPSGFPYSDAVCSEAKPATEEICTVPLCSQSGLHKWHRGDWGSCQGYCGTGIMHRTVECRRTDDGSVVTPMYCSEDMKPRGGKPCELRYCSSFRLVNRIAVARSWQVIELKFFVDDACQQMVNGRPFSGDYCRECECKNATGVWGTCGAQLAFDGHVPYRAQDGQLAAGTAWISECGQKRRCAARGTWIGLHLEIIGSIRCVKIMQSGDVNHQARELTLEVWDSNSNSWSPITEWAGIGGGKWIQMVVPQACTDLITCKGHGTVEGLPGDCACTCFEGYAGANCEYCITGYYGFPDCQLRPTHSKGWRLVALENTPSGTWHLSEVAINTDVTCNPAATVTRENIREYIASSASEDEDILRPERAFDAEGERTTWISQKCSDCGTRGELWIGVFLYNVSQVNCIMIKQGYPNFAVDSIALERWQNTTDGVGEWHRVRKWGGILQKSVDREFNLRLVCDEGLPPTSGNIEHDCSTEQLPWQSCTVVCRSGYMGNPAIFVCKDDFVLSGVMPQCAPKECTKGMPAGPGVTIDDCMGRRTDERCIASCSSGWTGAPLGYICKEDGTFREERTGRSGGYFAPTCNEGIEMIQVSSGLRSCWSFSACCVFLILLRRTAVGEYG